MRKKSLKNNKKDYYKILGVEKDTPPEEIKKAYRALAMKYHPDVNKEKGAEDKFKEISEAYGVLSNPDKLRKYEQDENFDFGGFRMDFDPNDIFNSTFERSIFNNIIFGNRPSFSGFEEPQQPFTLDNRLVYNTNLKSILSGEQFELVLKKKILCDKCSGKGIKASDKKCKICNGNGYIQKSVPGMMFQSTCNSCYGSGLELGKCKKCHGNKYEKKEEKVLFKMPPDISPLTVLRIKGGGNVAYNSGQKIVGDAFITIDYSQSQDGIKVSNGSIYTSINVPFDLVLREEKINVNIFGIRNIEFKLDSNNHSGDTYIIRGAGVSKDKSAFIKVFYDLPKNKISEEDRAKFIKVLEEIYGRSNTTFEPSTLNE